MFRKIIIALFLFFTLYASAQREIVYQVSQRSFFDSNGDGQGDFKGIQEKMDYLQWLGVNTILLSPLYQSKAYSNVYADDWNKTNKEYGNFIEYRSLVQEAHRRKMKIYQDFDLRYVTDKHVWFTEKSNYKNYLLLNDTVEYTPKDGVKGKAIAVNFKEPGVRGAVVKAMEYWINPDGGAYFYNGIDGFRFSNVSYSFGSQDNLLREFWVPVIKGIRDARGEITIMASPADSIYKPEDFYNIGFDAVFNTGLRNAIVSFDKTKIIEAAETTLADIPENKNQMVFVEGYDLERFASQENMSQPKLRAMAALNIFLGGIPVIYFGQETGTTTESFNWEQQEVQFKDKTSLLRFYKELLFHKKLQPALALGSYSTILSSGDEVISFLRTEGNERVIVVINLSDKRQSITFDYGLTLKLDNLKPLMGNAQTNFKKGGRNVILEPYAVQVWRM